MLLRLTFQEHFVNMKEYDDERDCISKGELKELVNEINSL